MEREETHRLLVEISFLDNRIVDDGTVEMWHRTVGSFDFETLERAVPIAFAESDAYLTPARLLAIAKRLREEKALEAQRSENDFSGDWVGPPSNLDELVAFYREVFEACPWKTDFVHRGARIQLYGQHLEEEIDKSVRAYGKPAPQPSWEGKK